MISKGRHYIKKQRTDSSQNTLPVSKVAVFWVSSLGWESAVLRSLLSFLLSALEDLSFEPLRNLLTNEVWGLVPPSEELFFLVWLMVKLKEVFLNKTSSCCFLFSRISEKKIGLSSLGGIRTSLYGLWLLPFLLFLLLVMFNIKIRMM